MRLAVLLLAAALLGGEEAEPWRPPPADPGSGPLPTGLTVTFAPQPGPVVLGEPLRLELVVSATQGPVEVLGELRYLAPDLVRRDAAGAEVREAGGPRFIQPGMVRLEAGSTHRIPLSLSWRLRPEEPGRYRFSAFADLGWGPERPDDPRRASCDITCVWPEPQRIAAIVGDALEGEQAHQGTAHLGFTPYVPELGRRAAAGSLAALEQLGEVPGAAAAEALLAIAQQPPAVWHDRQGDSPTNLGFHLLHRLADHLPPRRLPQEEAWWEQPEASWRRRMIAGVPATALAAARTAGLAWLEREPWGAAEVLAWSARPADRPVLLQAIARVAAETGRDNQAHMLWRLAYAIRLADPAAPPPDPSSGVAELVLWANHLASARTPVNEIDAARQRALLAADDELSRRIGVWSVARPVPPELAPVLAALLAAPGSSPALVDDLLWKLRDCDDPRALDAIAASLADRDRCRFLGDDLLDRLAGVRRVAAARALVARARSSGCGDEALRGITRLCLGVRPVLAWVGELPTAEGWRTRCDAWERWLDRHADRLAAGPIPAGDPAQPNHWLDPHWWFEAADGRRWFQPPAEL